jgi:hypothetical protein
MKNPGPDGDETFLRQKTLNITQAHPAGGDLLLKNTGIAAVKRVFHVEVHLLLERSQPVFPG